MIIKTIIVPVNSLQNAGVTVQLSFTVYSLYSHAKQRKGNICSNFRSWNLGMLSSSLVLNIHVSLLLVTTPTLKSILKHFTVIPSQGIVIQI